MDGYPTRPPIPPNMQHCVYCLRLALRPAGALRAKGGPLAPIYTQKKKIKGYGVGLKWAPAGTPLWTLKYKWVGMGRVPTHPTPVKKVDYTLQGYTQALQPTLCPSPVRFSDSARAWGYGRGPRAPSPIHGSPTPPTAPRARARARSARAPPRAASRTRGPPSRGPEYSRRSAAPRAASSPRSRRPP